MKLFFIYGTVCYDGETYPARKNRITRTVTVRLWSRWCPPYAEHRSGVRKAFKPAQ